MKKWLFFLTTLIALAPVFAYSQLIRATFITRECSLSCGANFIHNSEFVFTKDSIRIINPIEKIVGQYFIVKTRANWKDVGYNGTAKVVAMNISDSSISEFKLNLRKGKGYLNVYEKGDCKMIFKIESEGKTVDRKRDFALSLDK
jgi:hypothetical protein